MGLFNLAFSAGMAVGPIALGKFYDLMKPFGAFFAAAAALSLAIMIFNVSTKHVGNSPGEKEPA